MRFVSGSGSATTAQTGPADRTWKVSRDRAILICLLLVAALVIAYLPAIRGGFIWDDDDFVTKNATLRDLHGLYRIWFQIGATLQYYPLVYSTFWIENHVWGLNPVYFHVANVLLHGLGSFLLWRVLSELEIRGARLTALVFAFHPVCVESVAWITERKNVLSGVFYFAAALAYLKFVGGFKAAGEAPGVVPESRGSPWRCYALSLLLFACALLSKTVTCSLPAALLLVCWWKRGRLRLQDILPLLPFFAIGFVSGVLTAWMEKRFVGAQGAPFALTFLERCLIAGRALWFYAAKLICPAPLTFIYPRWHISTAIWWQWVFPVAAVCVVAALWLYRRTMGRGPLVAVLFFAGTLFPALGFFNVYPMRFSFVADHFQYLACIGMLALVGVGIIRAIDAGASHPLVPVILPAALLLVLWGLTFHQCDMYVSHEKIWEVTVARNPDSFIAHNNLGNLVLRRGLIDQAASHYQRVTQLEPNYEVGHYNLANVLMWRGRPDLAIPEYQKAVQLAPNYIAAHNNLGNVLFALGRNHEALAEYETAMRLDPNSAILCNNVAKLLATSNDASVRNGRRAIELARRAEQLSGGRDPAFLATLGAAHAETGQFTEAIATASRALDLAVRQNNQQLTSILRAQLSLYQSGRPYHERGP
jgi:Tfp pilus assembly protein PilF